MMSVRYGAARAAILALVLLGCADEEGAPEPDALVVDLPPSGHAAYLDVRLEPRKPFYTLEDRPVLSATVYDRDDAELSDVAVVWRVDPAGHVEGDTLVPEAEGQGAAWACAGAVCGVAHFYVDERPPELTIDVPTRGARVLGTDRILVAGQVRDAGGVTVYVNDLLATRQGDRFEAELPATFGLNRIDVVAYDGVRPAVRAVREVLWAPELLEVDETGAQIDDALVIRLDQALFDQDVPPPPPDETGLRRVRDIAGLLTLLIEAVEPSDLLIPRIETGPIAARVTGAAISADALDLTLQDGGTELFARLTVALDIAGHLDLDGRSIDLGGTLLAQIVARTHVGFSVGALGPTLALDDVDVAIEAINGDLRDATAQAVLDTFGSTLRLGIEGYVVGLVDAVVRGRVRGLLDGMLDQGLGVLASLPLPAVDLTLGFDLTRPQVRRRTSMTLSLAARVTHGAPFDPPYPSRGVAAESLDAPPPWPAGGRLAVALRLVAFNALLHELWRGGGLSFDLGDLGVMLGPLRGRIDARLPPVLVPGEAGGPYPIVLQVGELDLFVGDALEPNQYVVSLRAGVVLDTTGGGLRLDVAETPDVRVALVARGATPPIPADGLRALIESIVWSQVRAAIGPGLSLPTDQVALDPGVLGGLTPGLTSLRLVPDFPAVPVVGDGWLTLPAELVVEVR